MTPLVPAEWPFEPAVTLTINQTAEYLEFNPETFARATLASNLDAEAFLTAVVHLLWPEELQWVYDRLKTNRVT